jgi:signal transduction histidine kinase
MEVLFSSGDRTLRVVGRPGDGAGDMIEIVLPEAPLQKAMLRFGFNVLVLSVFISVITAALVYMALNTLLVRPMLRIAENMLLFSRTPEDASRIIVPSGRNDEIGTAERELAHMQTELSLLLHQKSRLAALGLAVSKINHDLRNMLANAQLLSDRLTSSTDATVQRFAPKLIASLDRAIAFCNDTLRFGRAEEAPPRRELIPLRPLVDEVADSLALPREEAIRWQADVELDLRIDADRDQLYRVLSNLARNAVQAIESGTTGGKGEIIVTARRSTKRVHIAIRDDGPGVPARARERLFQAFHGSTRRGGTGLGLTIAYELVAAHGGTLKLADTATGASFEIEIPDR